MEIQEKTIGCKVYSIILADDDVDDRMVFNEVVSEVAPNSTLNIVSDGFVLMSLLTNYVPDLLFLDLEMPLKNGLQCLLEIRQNPIYDNLPVIMFSSTRRPSNIQTAYEMGAHLFFSKPSTYSELKEALKAILLLDWSKADEIRRQYFNDGSYLPYPLSK